jgi:hypothetical protein
LFPELETSNGGTFAVIITLSNTWRIFQVKPINGTMFYVPDLGMFQLDQEYRYTFGKSEWYFYDQEYCNPISFRALYEIHNYLAKQSKKQSTLQLTDLMVYVDKIRKIEKQKVVIQQAIKAGATQDQLMQMLNDGSIEYEAQKLADSSKPEPKDLSEYSINWLNQYYREDVVVRYYLLGKIFTDARFTIRSSMPAYGIMPQRTMFKRNIGVAVINNRLIKLDPKVTVALDRNTGLWNVKSSIYGDFEIQDAKTRYRYGKTNLYTMMVETPDAKALNGVNVV